MSESSPSSHTEIGKPAHDFTLVGLDGDSHSLSYYRGRIVVLNFWSAECPWAERVDQALSSWLHNCGCQVVWLTVAANPTEPVEMIQKVMEERNLPMVLLDAKQQVSDLYGAVTTPHIYLVDAEGILAYRGAYDDVSFRQRNPTRSYFKEAVERLMDGKKPETSETDPYGCTIMRLGE
jgi:peroxiredoxin